MKTVFIVGAGASAEAHLPVGNELKSMISALLEFSPDFTGNRTDGDPAVFNAIRTLGSNNITPFLMAAQRISESMPLSPSIDNYLNNHKDDEHIERCGKLAIVRSILQAERASSLYVSPDNIYNTIDFRKTGNTWYPKFFQLLTEDCQREKLESRLQDIIMVVFNYDRCIEHFLFHALKLLYKLPDEHVASTLAHLSIYHPYGVAAKLPWQSRDNTAAFGAEPNGHQLIELAKGIKTFTEGSDPTASEIKSIRAAMADCNRHVYLGFAFHPLNQALLFPTPQKVMTKRTAFASAFGISDSDSKLIQHEVASFMGTLPEKVNMARGKKCG